MEYLIKNFFADFLLLQLFVSGCALLQKKVDPKESQTTDSGFRFKFAMIGDWYPSQGNAGLYVVGQKPLSDGTTKLAIARHGPIWTGDGKPMTSRSSFKI